jgi:hypothetical protein
MERCANPRKTFTLEGFSDSSKTSRLLESMEALVTAVSSCPKHSFSKTNRLVIRLLAGHGVADDAHAGEKVRHRSRVAKDPTQPNLRQVHLIHGELHDELRSAGFSVAPGDLGENITTRGIDLLSLPKGTRLHLGRTAVLELTGLRNPCRQLDQFSPGLMAAVRGRDEKGDLIFKCGIMGIVLRGGDVAVGDIIIVELPTPPHRRWQVV